MKNKSPRKAKKVSKPVKSSPKIKAKSPKKAQTPIKSPKLTAKKKIIEVAEIEKASAKHLKVVQSKIVTPKIAEPEVEVQLSQPSRAPRRIILGAGGVTSIVPVPQPVVSSPIGNLAVAETPQETMSTVPQLASQLVPHVASRLVEIPILERFAWNALPSNIPAHIKFLIARAAQECEHANSWPFAFAKFIALLPKEVCGMGFAIMIMSLDNNSMNIAKLIGYNEEKVNAYIENTRNQIEEKFSSLCGEIYRKWTAQLVGGAKEIESIIEHYLISKLDKSLQIMIGEVVLKVIGAENPVIAGQFYRNQWSLGSRQVVQ